jgi:hypothetical protein
MLRHERALGGYVRDWEGITGMAGNFFKRILNGGDDRTVVIQEIIEGAGPLPGAVRTDPSMAAVGGADATNPTTQATPSNQALVPGAPPPATTRGISTGPLDLARGMAQGLLGAAQVVGGKAVELSQTPQGRDVTNSLAGLLTQWFNRGLQLNDEQRQVIAEKMREDFTDFIKICGAVALSMDPPQRATGYALLDAFNRLVPVSDELRAAATPIGTGPLPVPPKRSSAASADEDQVVRKLTEMPKHPPRVLEALARQMEADARWAAQQLQLIQNDLLSERARREAMINDAKNRVQSLSKELLGRLKRLRKDLGRERSWLENVRDGVFGQ